MARLHYHVCNSFPGCLPESDPAVFLLEADALRYAREMQEENEELDSEFVVDVIPCTDNRPECQEACSSDEQQ
jgi:hypothetical protein